MLAHAREQDWQDDQQLITWPSYAELTKETALYRGSIGPARQELIAAGLILPLAGAHKRGGDDPIAAYKIHTTIIRSPDQRARGPAPRRAAPAIPEVQRGSAPGAGHAQCARVPVRLIDEEE
jgi:hypothetical protein